MVLLSNVEAPTEGVRFVQPQVTAIIETNELGSGVLTVAESSVTWTREGGQGFSLTYPSISLHAVSRDLSNFPQECLYLMVDARSSATKKHQRHRPEIQFADVTGDFAACNISAPKIDLHFGQAGQGDIESNGEDREEEAPLVEIRYIPADKSVLDQIFETMAQCQTLHPDEEDDFSDEEIGGENYDEEDNNMEDGESEEWHMTANDAIRLNPEGRANLERILRNSNTLSPNADADEDHVDDVNMEQK